MGNCLKCFQSTSEHPSTTLGSGVATSSSMHSGCHPTTHIVDGRYTGLAATTATTNINANDGNHQQLPHHLHVVRATFSSKERSHGRILKMPFIFNEFSTHLLIFHLETDELLSTRSPLKPANHCDTKRSSFKKSLALLNGNASTMCDIITAGKSLVFQKKMCVDLILVIN